MDKKSGVVILLAAILAFIITGCNEPRKPGKWEGMYIQSQSIIKHLSNENKVLRAESERAKRTLDNMKLETNALQEKLTLLETLLKKQDQNAIDEADRVFRKLLILSRKPVIVKVPEERVIEIPRTDERKPDGSIGKTALEEGDDGDFSATRVGEYIKVTLKGEIYFASGSDQLTSRGKKSLRKIAPLILSMGNVYYRVDGHTDSQPINRSKNRFRSNRHLSAMRALSVVEFLTSECGVPKEKIYLAGFGDQWPRSSNSTKQGQRSNRRVEIWVLPGTRLDIKK